MYNDSLDSYFNSSAKFDKDSEKLYTMNGNCYKNLDKFVMR